MMPLAPVAVLEYCVLISYCAGLSLSSCPPDRDRRRVITEFDWFSIGVLSCACPHWPYVACGDLSRGNCASSSTPYWLDWLSFVGQYTVVLRAYACANGHEYSLIILMSLFSHCATSACPGSVSVAWWCRVQLMPVSQSLERASLCAGPRTCGHWLPLARHWQVSALTTTACHLVRIEHT